MFYSNGFMLNATTLAFRRAEDGSLLMDSAEGSREIHNISSAFPLSNPGKMVTLRGEGGTEIGMLDDVRKLDRASRDIVLDELERSYFMPIIEIVKSIDEKLNVLHWKVQTDRGARTFQVRSARTSIRKLPGHRLIIRDVDGNRYEVQDVKSLDDRAQMLLEEFV